MQCQLLEVRAAAAPASSASPASRPGTHSVRLEAVALQQALAIVRPSAEADVTASSAADSQQRVAAAFSKMLPWISISAAANQQDAAATPASVSSDLSALASHFGLHPLTVLSLSEALQGDGSSSAGHRLECRSRDVDRLDVFAHYIHLSLQVPEAPESLFDILLKDGVSIGDTDLHAARRGTRVAKTALAAGAMRGSFIAPAGSLAGASRRRVTTAPLRSSPPPAPLSSAPPAPASSSAVDIGLPAIEEDSDSASAAEEVELSEVATVNDAQDSASCEIKPASAAEIAPSSSSNADWKWNPAVTVTPLTSETSFKSSSVRARSRGNDAGIRTTIMHLLVLPHALLSFHSSRGASVACANSVRSHLSSLATHQSLDSTSTVLSVLAACSEWSEACVEQAVDEVDSTMSLVHALDGVQYGQLLKRMDLTRHRLLTIGLHLKARQNLIERICLWNSSNSAQQDSNTQKPKPAGNEAAAPASGSLKALPRSRDDSPASSSSSAPSLLHLRSCLTVDLLLRDSLSLQSSLLSQLDSAEHMLSNLQGSYLATVQLRSQLIEKESNNLMRKFTMLSLVMLPLSLISSILGMNVRVPAQFSDIDTQTERETTGPFWTVIGVMVGVGMLSCAAMRKMGMW